MEMRLYSRFLYGTRSTGADSTQVSYKTNINFTVDRVLLLPSCFQNKDWTVPLIPWQHLDSQLGWKWACPSPTRDLMLLLFCLPWPHFLTYCRDRGTCSREGEGGRYKLSKALPRPNGAKADGQFYNKGAGTVRVYATYTTTWFRCETPQSEKKSSEIKGGKESRAERQRRS